MDIAKFSESKDTGKDFINEVSLMQISLYIFLWLLFPSLTKHIDECSHRLIATPIACLTSVSSALISVNIDQPQNISWCTLTTVLFDPTNVGWRDSRHVTGQIPAWTFNQSLILYWLNGWRYYNQTKITWTPRINVERVPLYLDCEQSLIFLFKVTARETQARELR